VDVGREAGQYYNHSFAPFQPDLNIANPPVRDEIAKIVGFWLTLGASGFRMDAVPFLGAGGQRARLDPDDGKRWLHALREYAMRRSGEAMLMGEANVAMDDVESFFEDHGDALHLQLGFLINQRLWLALARGEASPLEDLIRRLPVPPRDAGWGTFLRNHDELTPRQARAGRARRGLRGLRATGGHADLRPRDRRRTGSMLGGDGPRLRLAWSLLFSLPGTPVLLYGDEVGMVEDLGARAG
jgi:glycosidase